MFFYSTLLAVGLAVSAPWWLLRMATTERYREGLGERLGQVPPQLRKVVSDRRVVWVHAVSVGEVLAVSRLINELEAALNRTTSDSAGPPWTVVVSTTTRTGQALARERFGSERVFYFPLDFGFAVRAYLRALRPALVVLAESELWPRMLFECNRACVPVAVCNARVSDRSLRRALRVRPLWRRLLRSVALFTAQSEEDARRLVSLGAHEDSVAVVGNLKYDIRAPERSRMADRIRKVAGGRPILVAGSTVDDQFLPEEARVIRSWSEVLRRLGVLLVLAPRHPERFRAVHALTREYGGVRATELLEIGADEDGVSGESHETREESIEIVVLDTVGDLAAVYGVATVAFVGGSLASRGGHNPLEPARFGVPVLMGPSFENFLCIVNTMGANDGILIVPDENGLAEAALRLLRSPDQARSVGEHGREVFEREGGATARSIQALVLLMARSNPARVSEAVSA